MIKICLRKVSTLPWHWKCKIVSIRHSTMLLCSEFYGVRFHSCGAIKSPVKIGPHQVVWLGCWKTFRKNCPDTAHIHTSDSTETTETSWEAHAGLILSNSWPLCQVGQVPEHENGFSVGNFEWRQGFVGRRSQRQVGSIVCLLQMLQQAPLRRAQPGPAAVQRVQRLFPRSQVHLLQIRVSARKVTTKHAGIISI